MEKKKISMKKEMACEDVIKHLETLLSELKDGRIVVKNEEETLILAPAETVSMEIEAKVKKDKRKFALKLKWKEAGDESTKEKTAEDLTPAVKGESSIVEKEEAEVPAKQSENKEVKKKDDAPPAKKEKAKPAKKKTEPKTKKKAAADKKKPAADKKK
ncbi:conserved protein of unknown function [Pseudodesulfovibrio profundus]|uniref:Amphi-Trp domain-containing protein n=1 Tax=Pseudodesulfovibrio profundus TaxID=57320 RepID=A0A2C8FCC3_9BACT|nr:amphi-Trp domain-containing protein [Pseudodesulfovibrio profundus]SOB60176.1 conserved protein of unknown function [Pseudodesulfovibrio profundus]